MQRLQDSLAPGRREQSQLWADGPAQAPAPAGVIRGRIGHVASFALMIGPRVTGSVLSLIANAQARLSEQLVTVCFPQLGGGVVAGC